MTTVTTPQVPFDFPVWALSDTHFHHRRISEYEPIRQTLDRDHNVVMIERWREVVGEADTVLHLGDLALGKSEEFAGVAGQLPGQKYMLRGNHDSRGPAWYGGHGFNVIPDFHFDRGDWRIKVSHFPVPHGRLDDFTISVHGHVHSQSKSDRRYINLSVEVIDFRPVPLLDVLDARIAELSA